MGLAGAKNKRKWAKDPNNTAWSRNTDTFGQKILRSQGWAPGQYLGAQDASQSAHYTAASAGHIRAVLKDDNLGLGARRNQGDECTGLDALQELLGRLNGKGEGELAQERRTREDARVNKYLNRKLGTIRFVHGGFLVGDKVQELADELQREKEAAAEAEVSGAKEGKKDKRSKKRKAEEENGDVDSEKKKEKKSKKRKTEDADDESSSKRKKKEKRRKDKESTSEATTESESQNKEEEVQTADANEDASSRKKSKKDKKEKRKKSRNDKDASPEDGSDLQSKKRKKRRAEKEDGDSSTSPASAAASATSSTPSASGTSTPVSEVPHRHLARKRFIAQKRAAVMDPAALNQIFMIKA